MFLYLLAALMVAAAIHVWRAGARTPERIGEIGLRYLLAGYCGLPMVIVAVVNLAHPEVVAEHLGVSAGHPFQGFLGWAYLGMSLIAALALRYRGAFLIGPALCWAVFFAGATLVHLGSGAGIGGSRGQGAPGGASVSHGEALWTFATHGLISLLLVSALLASGVLKRPAR